MASEKRRADEEAIFRRVGRMIESADINAKRTRGDTNRYWQRRADDLQYVLDRAREASRERL